MQFCTGCRCDVRYRIYIKRLVVRMRNLAAAFRVQQVQHIRYSTGSRFESSHTTSEVVVMYMGLPSYQIISYQFLQHRGGSLQEALQRVGESGNRSTVNHPVISRPTHSHDSRRYGQQRALCAVRQIDCESSWERRVE